MPSRFSVTANRIVSGRCPATDCIVMTSQQSPSAPWLTSVRFGDPVPSGIRPDGPSSGWP
ncbi:hypothetical protein GCM10009558_067870 [Virgisporangium aurantiacum]